jgi:acylphosphatase
MEITRKHLKIKGKVQGVGFRQNAFILAQKLGLKGWVRNTHEGDVEVMIEGESSTVALFEEWCHEGPIHSVVTSVKVLNSENSSETTFLTFTIQKTN